MPAIYPLFDRWYNTVSPPAFLRGIPAPLPFRHGCNMVAIPPWLHRMMDVTTFASSTLRLCRDPAVLGIMRERAAAFLLTILRCSLKFRRASISIPRYRNEGCEGITIPPISILTDCFGFMISQLESVWPSVAFFAILTTCWMASIVDRAFLNPYCHEISRKRLNKSSSNVLALRPFDFLIRFVRLYSSANFF